MDGVGEIRRLDHVVLLVAAQAVLRAEGRADRQPRKRRERVQAVCEIARHRCGVREQRETLADERRAYTRLVEEPVNAEPHSSTSAKAS